MADAPAPTLLIQSLARSKPTDPAQVQVTASGPGIFATEAIRIAVQEAAAVRSDQAKSTLIIGTPIPADLPVDAPAAA